MMDFIAQSERESQVGCLRIRYLNNILRLFNPDCVLLLFVLLFLTDGFQLFFNCIPFFVCVHR